MQAHFAQLSLRARRLPAVVRTAWTTTSRVLIWWISFRVCRTALLLLETAPPELGNCGEMVRSQSFLYDDSGFVLYSTDVRMPSGQVERLCRKTERDHAAIRSAGTTNQDSARPCPRCPCPARCGATRTFAGPTSSTSHAPSLPLQRKRWHCTTSFGTQRRLNCPRKRDPGSLMRVPQALTEVLGVGGICISPQRKESLQRVQRHGMQCCSPLDFGPPEKSGVGRRDTRSRIGGGDISLPHARLKLKAVAGTRDTRKARCRE